MLSGKLIHLIESHWDAITSSALQQIHGDRGMSHIAGLPEAELREWAHHILQNLGRWMSRESRDELSARYEALGKLRFEEAVPLAEAVAGLCTLKQKIFEYVHEHAGAQTTTDIYAEEELDLLVGRFFDFLICNLVRGYEQALRHAARLDVAIAVAAGRHARE